MAKEVKVEKESNNLPAYTSAENILSLLEAYRRKSGKEDEAKPIFGKAGSAYTNSKSAIRTFGLINETDCVLTELGRTVAFSNEDEKKSELSKVIFSFLPYETLLSYIFQKGSVQETDIVTITNYWGRFGQGSTPRNLDEAARLFGSMIEYVGLGKFIKGAKGRSSRIVWSENAYEIFSNFISGTEQSSEVDEVIPENTEKTIGVADSVVEDEIINTSPAYEQPAITYEIKPEQKVPNIITKTAIAPNITINVDMSDWSEEKIKNFFKYAYGKFEEETE